MKKTKKLDIFCKENNKEILLSEWDYERNINNPLNVDYDYSVGVWWKCKNNHSYKRSVISRTCFDLGCIYCNSNDILPIGTKNGCLTVVDIIQNDKCTIYKDYKCQCKCGNNDIILDEFHFVRKKHRYCDAVYDEGKHYNNLWYECGIRIKQKEEKYRKAKRIKESNYEKTLPYTIHESLEIMGIGEDKEYLHKGGRKIYFELRKSYKCRCYLCGKEFLFHYDDFKIRNDEYGYKALDGYYSRAYCNCHEISSFQWRTIDILNKYNVKYRVEVSFEDLYGIGNKNHLRYDFAIFDDDNNIKYLIECQGEQHYKPVAEFGGTKQYEKQRENDELKREYANENNIFLLEIPYTCNTYEKEEKFLKDNNII